MSKQIVVYLNEADIKHVLSDDKIIVYEGEVEKINLFFDILEKDNLEFKEAMYIIYENFGHEFADQVAQKKGYESFDHFLRTYGYIDYDGHCDYNTFENYIQQDYVEDINNIKDSLENLKEVSVKK